MNWLIIFMFAVPHGYRDVVNPEWGYKFATKADCDKRGAEIAKKLGVNQSGGKPSFIWRCEKRG